ncbi:allose kinase [Caproiciproducens galactitolivorans]|uniref:Allose kinase n=1 Tax=Caproiciproducens galactitolivorans TaxID=642589 RepID=A0ABT4BRT4_9FIRM|nr:allose kinase [Caproiciproducens galactitolivorans]MCY1713505.1 allose kinase [Caproiciproducens galactitolivorans]
MQQYVIGIDIGGTNFRIGMVSQDGSLQNFEKHSSSVLVTGNAVEILSKQIDMYLDTYRLRGQVAAISIGIPSLVSKDKKTIYSTPNLKGFDNLNLADPLKEYFQVPVFIDRDVNYLLQNDIKQLGLNPKSTILGFYVGTGLGNAVYIEGKFYTGKNGSAGELGHIPMYGITRTCSCGNIGCSEVLCSGKYLEELTRECFPGTSVRNVFKQHIDDPRLQKYVTDLAIPIATEVNILDPDTIILAGGVIFMAGFPKELLLKALYERLRKPYPAQNLDIRFSKHTQQSGVLGSADFAWRQLLSL